MPSAPGGGRRCRLLGRRAGAREARSCTRRARLWLAAVLGTAWQGETRGAAAAEERVRGPHGDVRVRGGGAEEARRPSRGGRSSGAGISDAPRLTRFWGDVGGGGGGERWPCPWLED